jgi:hypothetical protein
MSNYVHVVLHVDVEKAQGWSDKQVLALWHTLYKDTLLTQKFMRDEVLSQGELVSLNETITVYRKRLYDINWLMRNLNEYTAILACMIYVDLNPIRAKMAKTQESSDHTSIQQRINTAQHTNNLMPFIDSPRQDMPKGIAFSLKDYCELVDTIGKIIRDDNRGYIEEKNPILERLGLDSEQ